METIQETNEQGPKTQSTKQETTLVKLIARFPTALIQQVKKRPLLGVAIALVIIVFVLLVLVLLLPKRKPTPQPFPSKPPQSLATPSARTVSEVGKSEEFINLENELNAAIDEINNLDVLESQFTPPLIDLNVEFSNE